MKTSGVPFYKVSGGGNDFVLLDERQSPITDQPGSLATTLCRRGRSIGADGLLSVRLSHKADLQLVYFNADGSRAFCGNGTLCVARWAHQEAGMPPELRIETDQGVIPVAVLGRRVKMQVPPPTSWRQDVSLAPAALEGKGTLMVTGCPHLVVLMPSLPEGEAFEAVARPLRQHPDLQPDGANVDLVVVEDEHRLRLRTFERGVEAETLASGTGCLAAAMVAASVGRVVSPVSCIPRSGLTLQVSFQCQEQSFNDLALEGEAHLIYQGRILPDAG